MTAEILQVTAPDQPWWVLFREDEYAPWQRERLVQWALVDDGPGIPNYVAGLIVGRDGVTIEVAPPGRYMTQREWEALGPCRCARPVVSALEPAWCSFCGCEIRA